MKSPGGRFWAALGGIVLFALAVRAAGIRYDDGHYFHPDERRIAEAVTTISFSPLQLDPKFFAYGSLPFYVTRVVCGALGRIDPWYVGYDGALYVGRAVSAFWAAAAVLLTGILGRRLFGSGPGLLGAFLLSASVLHVQNGHFATNDVPLTTLVLLALVLLVRAAEDGRARDFILAGGVLGLALATKVSALPAFAALVAAALLRVPRDASFRRPARLAAGGFLAAAVGFLVGEPYAVLDSSAFLHDVVEQSRMVREAGLVPYTNQYVGTTNYFYELLQIAAFGMGPLLTLAAIAGVGKRLARPLRLLGSPEAVVAAYAVPLFLVTGAFEVKFPRYLLPLYPLLALAAAVLLSELAARGRAGRFVRAAVVAGTLVWLAAFLRIGTKPFTVHAASEWAYDRLKPGSTLVVQEWDEGFPFHLTGDRAPERFHTITFPYYAEDGAAKGHQLAAALADADVVVLQTKRIVGAVTRNEARFPMTARFFRELLAGDLGYRVEKTFLSRPSFLGLSIPTELLDESLSVYDHPKLVVLRNVDRLPRDVLASRILHGLPSIPLTRDQLLLADGGPLPAGEPALGGISSSLFATLLFVALLEALGLAAAVLLARRIPVPWGLPALGKVTGVLVFAFVPWLLVSLGIAPFGRPVLLGTLAALVGLAIAAMRDARRERFDRADLLWAEAAFWIPFTVFLGFRLLNPEITWGEKPMDFAFLNALYRSVELPPGEPWFAGASLSYTYFGHFVVASLGRALGVAPALAFNLGIATFAGLAGAGLFAAGSFVGRSRRAGAWALVLGFAAGNLSGLRELLARRVVNFDTFWATSRVVKEGINEYPFWSFLFADLHAHVLAIPFALATVAWLALWAGRDAIAPARRPGRFALLLGLALSLGATFVTNGWSLPTYAGLTAFVFALDGWRRGRGSFFSRANALLAGIALALVSIGAAFLLFRPFWKRFAPPPRNIGWEVGPYATVQGFLEVFGLPLILLVPFILGALVVELRGGEHSLSGPRRSAVTLLVLALAFSILVTGAAPKHAAIRPLVAGLAIVSALLALRRRLPEAAILPAAFAGWGFALLTGSELLFVWDRMNTVFKFWLDASLLFAVAGGAVAAALFARWPEPGRGLRLWRGATVAALLAAFLTTAIAGFGALRPRRAPEGPIGTLDGSAWFARHSPADAAAAAWLNRNVPGIPTLVEAWGPSYQEFSRLSMQTGLPIVLGWDYHVLQRGRTQAQIERRRKEVATIYLSDDRNVVARALERTGAALLWFGPVEARAYGERTLETLRGFPDVVTPLWEAPNGIGGVLFAVNRAFERGFPARRVKPAPDMETADAGSDDVAAPRSPRVEVPDEPDEPPGVLRQPRGVAVGGRGEAYVVDFGNSRIQRFDRDRPHGGWGRAGQAEGEFRDPCGIAVGPDGLIYVADSFNGRVQVFDVNGTFQRAFGSELFGPRAIAVAADGSVWLADTGNDRIVRYAPSGERDRVIGSRGAGPAQFDAPTGIAVDRHGNVWVCDNGNGRLQVLGPDGKLLREAKIPGWKKEVFSEPTVAVTADGRGWITVPLEGEVRLLSPELALLRTIRGDSVSPPLFVKPMGIAIVPENGKVVVTDLEGRLVWLP